MLANALSRFKTASAIFVMAAVVFMSACAGGPNRTNTQLSSITVTPANATIGTAATQQFTATGHFSDGTSQDLTGSATWSSQNAGVATIAAGGLATAKTAGSSTITAMSGTVGGSTLLTVSAATLTSIAVTPANPTVAKNATQQFTAMGTFSDGSTQNLTNSATWSSATTSVATISSTGLAKGVSAGTSTIQAASGAVTGSTVLTVSAATLSSIAVTPANPAITAGATQQFTATGTFSDASTQNITSSVTWSSSNTGIATIAASGLATSITAGSSTIQATSGSVHGSTLLTVNAVAPTLSSIAVTPANPSIQNGATQQFTATGTYSDNSTKNITSTVTWTSATTGVATINSSGLATSVSAGTSTIEAALGSVNGSTILTVTAGGAVLTTLVVSPQNPVIADAGATQTFTATGHFSDGTTQNLTNSATWSSSNTAAATVSVGTSTSATLASGQVTGYTSIKATVGSVSGVSILSVTNHVSNPSGFAGVFTQHNDILRTGQNTNETALTPAVVSSSTTFGKKFSQALDGFAYAQPLYEQGVSIGGTKHNVVFVATENDTVYAFDADSNTVPNASPLWHANLIDTMHGAAAGATPVTNAQVNCGDLVPQIGITSTPVIDPSTGTMYVETKSSEGSSFVHRLHAIDITTGNEKLSGPTVISASVNVSGGTVTFNDLRHMNRPGLLWLNGVVYLAYASHCDNTPYHGWLFAYDATSLSQKGVFLSTPENTGNGGLAGFWMSGGGVAADSNANIYIASGNGDFDTTNIPAQLLGDSVIKLFLNGSSISATDYFTPWDQGTLDGGDTDVGSGGTLLLPDQAGATAHELIQVGKQGTIYLINRDQFTAGNLHFCKTCTSTDTQIAQELRSAIGGLFSLPAYWNGSVYFAGAGDNLRSFALTNGVLPTTSSAKSGDTFGFPGATPAISANGNSNGIVWAIHSGGGAAILVAYDPANALASLYSSANQAGDQAGTAVKFTVPTIANGKVFVGTQTELDVYGTLP